MEELLTSKRETPLELFWKRFSRNRMAVSGMYCAILIGLLAIVGHFLTAGEHPLCNPSLIRLPDKFRPPLSRVSPDVLALDPEARPPLGIYILGTDGFGRDVFSRMLEGAGVALSVGFVAMGISTLVGILLGSIAGFFGATRILFFTVDGLLMKIVDVMLCFPAFFLILTIIAVQEPNIWTIMVVIGLTSWMGTCRLVRAEFLSLREQEFVAAAKALGIPPWRIMLRHILPNALAPVLVSANLGIASAILYESALSYLGFGVPPPHATWGNILTEGKNYLFDAPYLTFIPGLAIMVTALSFNLFGEGVRETLSLSNPT